MRAVLEPVEPSPGSSWAFQDRRLADGIPFEWHNHPAYELTLTLNSRGFRYVGVDVDPYDDGDLVLLGPGLPHSWLSHEAIDARQPHRALVVKFTQEWVSRLTSALPEVGDLSGIFARASQGLQFGASTRAAVATSIMAMSAAPPLARLVLLLEVLDVLSRDHEARTLSNVLVQPDAQLSADPRFARVLEHLHLHFAEPISATQMAEIACVSTSGFHRMFRRHTFMTLVAYLTKLRIGRACSLLISSSQSITSVATDAGYSNLSLFNRQFAEIKGETPGAFRKRHQVVIASLRNGAAA